MNAIAKDNPIYEKAVMKVIEMSQDEKERRYAEAEEEQRFRERSLYDTGHTEGKAEGIAEGIAEGKAEGKIEGIAEGIAEGKIEGEIEGEAKGKSEDARAMKADEMDITLIQKYTGLSIEEIEKL